MKDIKKYFDQFFKELKDQLKNIQRKTDISKEKNGLFEFKNEKDKNQEQKDLQVILKKTFDTICFNSKNIDDQIRIIFTEFNELSLIHESKLGYALKDLQ